MSAIDPLDEKYKELEHLKSNFIAIASHELRTPLGLILGHATFLNEIVEEESYKNQLEIIIKNAVKLKEIIEGISKIENFQSDQSRVRYELIEINQFADEVTQSYKEAAGQKKISLKIEKSPFPLNVNGDPEKLSIALGNIIDNAIEFSHQNGDVKVKVEPLAQFVKLSVIDHGIGIPAKYIQRVFDRFFQVEDHLTRYHDGMGLGLSITKAMIEDHGGLIWAESVEGEGSTFSFLLPVKNTD